MGEFMVQMVTGDGAIDVAGYEDRALAETRASALAAWMDRKGEPGQARVLFEGEILFAHNAGRASGTVLDGTEAGL